MNEKKKNSQFSISVCIVDKLVDSWKSMIVTDYSLFWLQQTNNNIKLLINDYTSVKRRIKSLR